MTRTKILRLLSLQFFFIFFFQEGNAQETAILQNYNFDSSYTIFCSKAFLWAKVNNTPDLSQYFFLVNKLKDLNSLKQSWKFKEIERPQTEEDFHLDIIIVKNKRPVSDFLLYPVSGSVYANKKWYAFDTGILNRLHVTHPLNCTATKRTFNSIDAYRQYYDSAVKQHSLLSIEAMDTTPKGTYTIIIEKSAEIKSPKDAFDLIKNEFIDPQSEGKYDLSYEMDEYNLSQPRQGKMRITVVSDEAIFQRMKKSKFEVSDWKGSPIYVYTYWKL